MRAALAAFILLCGFAAQAAEEPEPPPPKASPVISVMEESLPRAGGILVFGGTRGLGLEVVKSLVARKEHVTVLARSSSDTAALKTLGVEIVMGDALDPDSLKQAISSAPFRAVVSTLGGHGGDYRVDTDGNKNVVDATKNAGLDRIVLVTALGTGDSIATMPWYVRFFMKDYFIAKSTAEAYLTRSGLDYTIIRPGVLLDSPKAGEPALAATGVFGGITRAELGKLVAGTVDDKSTFKKVYAAADAKRSGLWALLTY